MRIARKCDRHASRKKAVVARVAPPRTQSNQRSQEIQRAWTVGSKTVCAAALRADHSSHIPELLKTETQHNGTLPAWASQV